MLRKLKNTVKGTQLESVARPLYTFIVKRPYWWYRRYFNPVTIEMGGISACFIAEEPSDLSYYEIDSEREVLNDILSNLERDDVFFDIGANIGLYTCFAMNVSTKGKVIALEPSPPAFEKLSKNIDINDGTATPLQIAVSDINDTVEFAVDVNDRHSRRSTLNIKSEVTEYLIKSVPCRQLSSIVNQVGSEPTVMKIDVEGAEYDVLSGLEDYSKVRTIYCEIHHFAFDDFGFCRNDIISKLKEHDYDVHQIYEHQETECIKAKR